MKVAAIIALPLCLASVASAQTAPGKVAMRDAATHETLARELRMAVQEDPMKNFTPSPDGDPSELNRPVDLLSQSDFICFGGIATLVPKRAVLHVPANMQSRLEMQPGVQIYNWLEFFSRNRGWITAIEVTRRQAEGHEPLAAETLESMAKGRNLVVATYQGGPISVLPLKEPVVEPQAASTR